MKHVKRLVLALFGFGYTQTRFLFVRYSILRLWHSTLVLRLKGPETNETIFFLMKKYQHDDHRPKTTKCDRTLVNIVHMDLRAY